MYPGSTKVLLDECCYLNWQELSCILKTCKRLEVLSLSWIGYLGSHSVQLDFQELNINSLCYLNVSHCLLSDREFKDIASNCKRLSVLILQCCTGISRETFESSSFKVTVILS